MPHVARRKLKKNRRGGHEEKSNRKGGRRSENKLKKHTEKVLCQSELLIWLPYVGDFTRQFLLTLQRTMKSKTSVNEEDNRGEKTEKMKNLNTNILCNH